MTTAGTEGRAASDTARPSSSWLAAAAIVGLALRLAFALGYWNAQPLTRDERAPHRRMARDDGGCLVDLGGADRARHVMPVDADVAVVDVEDRAVAQRRDSCLVGDVDPVVLRLPRDGAVHRAGVDVPVAEPSRDRTRHRALPRSRWSIDRDDQLL